MNRRTCLALGWLVSIASTMCAAAATYNVGPGQPLATPADVPWESLLAGDTVCIHWRATPYLSKWVICRQGTAAQPITIQGVPGPNGELPVVDGNGATTRLALDYWNEPRGVIKIGGANIPADTTPTYIVLDGLEIRGGRPPYSFTDDSGAGQSYPNNAAAIYVEKGDHITIRNCAMRDCGNGLFVAAASSDVLVEGNYIFDNGNVGSIYEHNSYTAAAGITFQYNRYGPLRTGCLGNNLKDRSAGTVIRYNWIESGNRQLDLVDAEDSVALQQDPRYRSTFVYGNILIEPDGAGNRQIIHYGGDSGNEPIYRKGKLYLHHNTIISTRVGRTTLLRLSTNDESADCRNNLIYATDNGNQLELIADAGALFMTHNWLKPGRVNSFASGYTGTVTDDGTSITGSDPGFINFALQNFRLQAGSACVNAAMVSAAGAELHVPVRHYLKHQRSEARRQFEFPSGQPLDLGAYEFAPFEAWQGEQFGNEAENPAVAGEQADPDGDGLRNLVEYAFGLDPHVASRSGLPQAVVMNVAGQLHLAVQFQQRSLPHGLIYATSVSGNLVDWQAGGSYVGGLPPTSGLPHTVDASDVNWTRVRLVQPMSALPLRLLGVNVRRE